MPKGTYDHAWRVVREAILTAAAKKDGGVPLCRIRGRKCTRVATQVDHIVPVEAGGARLDPGNLRPSCGPCNIGRASRGKASEGWRRAKTHIVLVAGPPAAGKTTYAREHARPEDLVIDYDAISAALGPTLPHGSKQRHSAVMAARNALITRVRRGELDDVATVWLISTNPDAEKIFPHHELVIVDPGVDTVLAQARRAGRPAHFESIIRDWYAKRASRSTTVDGRTAAPSREWLWRCGRRPRTPPPSRRR